MSNKWWRQKDNIGFGGESCPRTLSEEEVDSSYLLLLFPVPLYFLLSSSHLRRLRVGLDL